MRQGRPVLRYSDTGLGGEIDHFGIVHARSVPEHTFITGELTLMTKPTPYMLDRLHGSAIHGYSLSVGFCLPSPISQSVGRSIASLHKCSSRSKAKVRHKSFRAGINFSLAGSSCKAEVKPLMRSISPISAASRKECSSGFQVGRSFHLSGTDKSSHCSSLSFQIK